MVVATATDATVTVVNGTTARTVIVGTGMTATQVQTTGKITTRAVISATL
jgi:flavin-dependent dehydrogenase